MARILIVEDDPQVAGLYRDKLTLAGHEVTVATGGDEGLEKAMTGNADIILLDIVLPDMDGITLLRRLRAADHGRPVPVILLTNTPRPEGLAELEGMYSDYLIKVDLTLDDLVATIEAHTGDTPSP
jgi:two-component system, OmpR family, copper resistance phosphate regulon response regulator CusR